MLRILILTLAISLYAGEIWAGMAEDCNSNTPKTAISGCTAAIKSGRLQNKGISVAYNNLGSAHAKLQQYSQAIKNYTQAIKFNPKNVGAYYNRGSSYDDDKQYNRAIEDYTQAIKLSPSYADAYYNRGRTYGKLEDYSRAIKDYTRAIKLNPQFTYAYINRGNTYINTGKYDNAMQDYATSNSAYGKKQIKWMQNWLRERNAYKGAIDGVYGRGTRAALIACTKNPDCWK